MVWCNVDEIVRVRGAREFADTASPIGKLVDAVTWCKRESISLKAKGVGFLTGERDGIRRIDRDISESREHTKDSPLAAEQ